MRYASAYAVAFAIFLVIDGLWLGLVARSFYMARIGELILERPRWAVALGFYALYVVGIIYFAVSTGLAAGDWRTAALNGALFGFFAYLTYDATNLATLKGYDPLVAAVDVAWGTTLTATVSGLTVAILSALGRAPT